jgi:dipeptidyl-peptidase 4
MLAAGYLLAPGLAQLSTFFRCCVMHRRNIHPRPVGRNIPLLSELQFVDELSRGEFISLASSALGGTPLPAARFRFFLAIISAAPLALVAQSSQKPLTVDAIYGHGSVIGNGPEQLTWSPDGKHLTYLESGQLIDLDPASGHPHVLISRAKLAPLTRDNGTETDRDHRQRYNMAGYLWAPDSQHLLFDADGHLWIYNLANSTGVEIAYTGAGSGDDPKFSPDGKSISFIRDNSLTVVRLREAGTPAIAVAPSTSPEILNGKVDWVYDEELETRSNYFWSPDSTHLAFLQMNETEVPRYPIEDWIPTHATLDLERYPQPGDPNPDVRVGVVTAGGSKPTWVKLPINAGQDYIPRFGWADRRTLWIETVTRNHKHRDIYLADPESGQSRLVLQISDDKFVDDNYGVWIENGLIVLSNWTDGRNHLYLYSFDKDSPGTATAGLQRQLTSGNFDVGEIYNVDFGRRQIEYASNEGNPLEQQLWRVDFDGKRTQLTEVAGFHTGKFSANGEGLVDRFSTRLTPPVLRICQIGGKCNMFWQTRALEPYHLRAPEQFEVAAHNGSTLYATLLLPDGVATPASVPLILNPYGGPGAQVVGNKWGDGLLFDELLAQHGFAVLHADNRGSPNRGRAFAQAAWHNFGPVQLEDQLTVLDAALAKYPQLDSKRLGWWGWSWGGTFTLYAMTHSDRFRAGIAVAPVTSWQKYDSIYTERYLNEPADFPTGYKDFSVVNSAAHLKGRLLLVHGTGDDNVHIGNTIQFIQALIEANIPYDLQIYPRKTHSISGADVRTHLYNRILAQFEQYLKPAVANK